MIALMRRALRRSPVGQRRLSPRAQMPNRQRAAKTEMGWFRIVQSGLGMTAYRNTMNIGNPLTVVAYLSQGNKPAIAHQAGTTWERAYVFFPPTSRIHDRNPLPGRMHQHRMISALGNLVGVFAPPAPRSLRSHRDNAATSARRAAKPMKNGRLQRSSIADASAARTGRRTIDHIPEQFGGDAAEADHDHRPKVASRIVPMMSSTPFFASAATSTPWIAAWAGAWRAVQQRLIGNERLRPWSRR